MPPLRKVDFFTEAEATHQLRAWQHQRTKKGPPNWEALVFSKKFLRKYSSYFTWSMTFLKASGWFNARSARTLRLSSMPLVDSLPMNTE